MSQPTVPDLQGKLLLVYCRGRDILHPLLLANPCFQQQAGRTFLVGSVPPGDSDVGWSDGVQRAIAWDLVESYLVYDSIEDYTLWMHGNRHSRVGPEGLSPSEGEGQ